MKTVDDIRRQAKNILTDLWLDITEADGNIKVIQEDSTTAELLDETLAVARKLQEGAGIACSELETLKWELSKALKAEEVKG